MVNPGIIYHKDTRGNKGFFSLEDMKKKDIMPTPFTHALHYASSVFEGIRAVWDPNKKMLNVVCLDEHAKRLMHSMKKKMLGNYDIDDLYMDYCDKMNDAHKGYVPLKKEGAVFLEVTEDEIKDAIIRTVRENVHHGFIDKEKGCYIRPNAYRDQVWDEDGFFNPGLGVFSLKHNVNLEIIAFTWGKYLERDDVIVYPEGIDTPLRHIKSGGNYAFGGIVKDWAMARGYAEGMITDTSDERNVLEGGGENLFVYFKDKLSSPMLDQSILPGTKRNIILTLSRTLAPDYGYEVKEEKIPLDEVLGDDVESAAFSGTAAGYTALGSLYDPKTGARKEFDKQNPLLVATIKEYANLISGGEVHKDHKKLQKKILTEVPL